MKKDNEFKGYWYLYIHSKLKERSINNTLSIHEAKSFLFEWRIPKWLRNIILKELESMGLIEIETRCINFNNNNELNIEQCPYLNNKKCILDNYNIKFKEQPNIEISNLMY